VEVDPPHHRERDEHTDLKSRRRYRDDEVPEDEQRPVDRCGQQLALRTALAVDDHTEPGEHRVQGDQQAERADGDERLVARTRVQRLLECGRDDEREQDGREKRHDELPRSARGQRQPPRGERGE
jgi:hypothetical protein